MFSICYCLVRKNWPKEGEEAETEGEAEAGDGWCQLTGTACLPRPFFIPYSVGNGVVNVNPGGGETGFSGFKIFFLLTYAGFKFPLISYFLGLPLFFLFGSELPVIPKATTAVENPPESCSGGAEITPPLTGVGDPLSVFSGDPEMGLPLSSIDGSFEIWSLNKNGKRMAPELWK